jgi:hypothetical protein
MAEVRIGNGHPINREQGAATDEVARALTPTWVPLPNLFIFL